MHALVGVFDMDRALFAQQQQFLKERIVPSVRQTPGFVAGYRKIHLPCLGADRFTDPGDRPFAVHDLGGLRLGMNICFDGSYPESARILTLLGADSATPSRPASSRCSAPTSSCCRRTGRRTPGRWRSWCRRRGRGRTTSTTWR